jgi:hypothetical protein
MPYDDPDRDDPLERVGVSLPVAGKGELLEMATCLAEEFAALGHDGPSLLALFRDPFYSAAHLAWMGLGEEEIARIVAEVSGGRAWGAGRDPEDAP